jgi:hypothetical protein
MPTSFGECSGFVAALIVLVISVAILMVETLFHYGSEIEVDVSVVARLHTAAKCAIFGVVFSLIAIIANLYYLVGRLPYP